MNLKSIATLYTPHSFKEGSTFLK